MEEIPTTCDRCGRPLVVRFGYLECWELCRTWREDQFWDHFEFMRLRRKSVDEVLEAGRGE